MKSNVIPFRPKTYYCSKCGMEQKSTRRLIDRVYKVELQECELCEVMEQIEFLQGELRELLKKSVLLLAKKRNQMFGDPDN